MWFSWTRRNLLFVGLLLGLSLGLGVWIAVFSSISSSPISPPHWWGGAKVSKDALGVTKFLNVSKPPWPSPLGVRLRDWMKGHPLSRRKERPWADVKEGQSGCPKECLYDTPVGGGPFTLVAFLMFRFFKEDKANW